MRTALIFPASVLEAIEWPQSNDVIPKEMDKLRRALVRILTDRVNREETTTENQRAYNETMGQIRAVYNPSGYTTWLAKDASSGRCVQNIKQPFGSRGDDEVKAVLKVLSQLTGNEYKTIADLM